MLRLLVGGLSQRAAARAADVNENTVSSWTREPDFAAALERAQAEATADAVKRVARASTTAIDRLVYECEHAEEAKDRIAAAKELARLAGMRPPEKLEVSALAGLTDAALAAKARELAEKAEKLGGGT